MRLLICGDRNWKDKEAIHKFLSFAVPILEITEVIHGGAKGADSLGGEVATALNVPVKVFEANWDLYGRGAGPIRNLQMLNEGQPDIVLGFHLNIGSSKGTLHMLESALKAGKDVWLFDGDLYIKYEEYKARNIKK